MANTVFNIAQCLPKVVGKAAKKAGMAQKNIFKGDKKKNKKKRKESYVIFIYKVLKQVHPDTGISSKAMSIMNSFVNDIFGCTTSGPPSPAARHKTSAVRELAKHAVSEEVRQLQVKRTAGRTGPARGGNANDLAEGRAAGEINKMAAEEIEMTQPAAEADTCRGRCQPGGPEAVESGAPTTFLNHATNSGVKFVKDTLQLLRPSVKVNNRKERRMDIIGASCLPEGHTCLSSKLEDELEMEQRSGRRERGPGEPKNPFSNIESF
ncbi:hypothetical protein PR048_017590 [Dryococelus australis]|uniref:Core Histone H2A/H2B/H3 domain-containing protein n=1 Tax=Dryococelus australis TaxID=614101 RepID=A0ABQ9H9Y5_9NEOP|nr:hypothetical protein PR048_017590 [Dryococelus australis]